jgi:hypothetical protein
MAAAFGEIEGATKTTQGQVGQQKYKYADLTSVIEAIKPALIAHGLFFTQRPQPSEGGVTIETVIGHANGEELSLGSLFVPANKNDAQGFGSALTYARRYALVTAFGVPVEDDDGNAAARGQSKESAVSPSQPNDRAARGRENGPTKSALDRAENEIVHELNGCGDDETLIAYLETEGYKTAKALLEEHRPSALYGPAPADCPEYVPIKTRIARMVAEFRSPAREQSPVDAG